MRALWRTGSGLAALAWLAAVPQADWWWGENRVPLVMEVRFREGYAPLNGAWKEGKQLYLEAPPFALEVPPLPEALAVWVERLEVRRQARRTLLVLTMRSDFRFQVRHSAERRRYRLEVWPLEARARIEAVEWDVERREIRFRVAGAVPGAWEVRGPPAWGALVLWIPGVIVEGALAGEQVRLHCVPGSGGTECGVSVRPLAEEDLRKWKVVWQPVQVPKPEAAEAKPEGQPEGERTERPSPVEPPVERVPEAAEAVPPPSEEVPPEMEEPKEEPLPAPGATAAPPGEVTQLEPEESPESAEQKPAAEEPAAPRERAERGEPKVPPRFRRIPEIREIGGLIGGLLRLVSGPRVLHAARFPGGGLVEITYERPRAGHYLLRLRFDSTVSLLMRAERGTVVLSVVGVLAPWETRKFRVGPVAEWEIRGELDGFRMELRLREGYRLEPVVRGQQILLYFRRQ